VQMCVKVKGGTVGRGKGKGGWAKRVRAQHRGGKAVKMLRRGAVGGMRELWRGGVSSDGLGQGISRKNEQRKLLRMIRTGALET